MEIITTRLRLNPIDMTYAEDVFVNFTSQVCAYMYPNPAEDISETRSFIEKSMNNFDLGKEIVFAASLKETNEFIGCMGIHHIDTDYPELGIWTKVSCHGNGYGLEGMNAIIEFAKKNYSFKSLRYPVDRRNFASRRIPELNGGIIVDRMHVVGAIGNELEIIEYKIPLNETIEKNNKIPRIIFDGDSITDVGRDRNDPYSLGRGYASLFGKYFPDAEVRNLGVSGHRTRELLERWNETLSLKPDILSILIGINDIWHLHKYGKELGPDEYKNNLDMILSKTKQELPACKIVLIEPFAFPIGHYEPSWQADLDNEIQIVGELAKKYDCIHIQMQSELNKFAQSFSMQNILFDGVHPNLFGHSLIANILIKTIGQLVQEYYQSN